MGVSRTVIRYMYIEKVQTILRDAERCIRIEAHRSRLNISLMIGFLPIRANEQKVVVLDKVDTGKTLEEVQPNASGSSGTCASLGNDHRGFQRLGMMHEQRRTVPDEGSGDVSGLLLHRVLHRIEA